MMSKGKPACVLLIDDDEPTNFINRMMVEGLGCSIHVEAVQGGKEALEYLSRKGRYSAYPGDYPHPDLILLDINMPAMNGWEFLDIYKGLPPLRKEGVRIIMLTTSLNPDDEARAAGMPEIAGFRYKPLTVEMFCGIVRDFF